MHNTNKPIIRSTTILAVKKDNKVAIAGDGQVSLGQTVMKSGANKIRMAGEDKVACGFAGSTADALTLFTKFEGKLKEYHGNVKRAAVELSKDWRTDKILRRLEAMMIVASTEGIFTLSGTGDVIEPDDGIAAIGSGGSYALSAARALLRKTKDNPREIVTEAMKIAAEICVYTNDHLTIKELG